MKKNNKNNNYLILLLLVILIIIIISFFILKRRNYESFANNSIGLAFETGVSGISSTGTITFKKPFSSIPIVFTQMNASPTTSEYIFSVNIFNVTNTEFSYSKNQAYNAVSTISDESSSSFLKKSTESFISNNMTFSVPKISESKVETFNWIAIA